MTDGYSLSYCSFVENFYKNYFFKGDFIKYFAVERAFPDFIIRSQFITEELVNVLINDGKILFRMNIILEIMEKLKTLFFIFKDIHHLIQ